jgi:hypothetical protein
MPRYRDEETGQFISREEYMRQQEEKEDIAAQFEPADDTDLLDFEDFSEFGEEEYEG